MRHKAFLQDQPAVAAFFRHSMGAPLLSREEEFALARAWRDERDERALHRLTQSYLRLVVAIAVRFRAYGLPVSDLVQEGSVGLMQAAERFDPERDVRFSTYATWWVRSAIQDYVLRNWSIVRSGTTTAQKALFFNFRRLRARIEEAEGHSLDDTGRKAIARALSVPLAEVEQMEQRLSAGDQSLDAPLGEESEESFQSLLHDERSSPEANVIALHDGARRQRWLMAALGELDGRERRIIEARRLAESAVTLEDLGRMLGVSKERVRQIETRALGKLKRSLAEASAQPCDLLLEG